MVGARGSRSTRHRRNPDSERGRRFIDRLSAVPPSEVIGVAIVTVEERMRGWLAVIAKEKQAIRQVMGYQELGQLFEFYQQFEIARAGGCHLVGRGLERVLQDLESE